LSPAPFIPSARQREALLIATERREGVPAPRPAPCQGRYRPVVGDMINSHKVAKHFALTITDDDCFICSR
jgi:hypothetical protein